MANSVPIAGKWFTSSTQKGSSLQGSAPSLQSGGSAGIRLQGSSPTLQSGNAIAGRLQPAANPMGFVDPVPNAGGLNNTGVTGGLNGGSDPAAAAKAADAAKAAQLRTQVTQLVNSIKDIFNSRYGQVDAAAGEQVGKLNERFGNESADITNQVTGENAKIGAGAAAGGVYSSSYRGNNVDTVTRAGEGQIRDLGTELQDNVGKVGSWVAGQKQTFDAEKGGLDLVASRLAESTDPGELSQIRNSLDARITQLRAGDAGNNTQAQNMSALASIAPTNARAVQLKTTLSNIINGNADPTLKSAIGAKLIQSAGLSPEEAQRLQQGFVADLNKPA